MRHDVFISYSSNDEELAKTICETLESSGIRCWIAPRNIGSGDTWSEAIIRAIRTARAMVLLLTTNSNSSRQVLREVEHGVRTGIPIIPFRIEDISPSDSLDYFISAHQWLDGFDPPLAKRIAELTDSLCRLLHISKQTGIPEYAATLMCSEAWRLKELFPQTDQCFASVDAVAILGTTEFTEKGVIVIHHLEGADPSRIAFLDININTRHRRYAKIRWLYSTPPGCTINRIAYKDPRIVLEELGRSGMAPLPIVRTLDVQTGRELPPQTNSIGDEVNWHAIHELDAMRGQSVIVHVDGRVLEIATQKEPFVKFRWIAPGSEIATVSRVAYPLKYSYVAVACYDSSLYCLRVYDDNSHDQPSLNWYTVERHASQGYGLRLCCNTCGVVSEYDPRDGHTPGSRCPSCGKKRPEFNLYGW